MNSGLKPEISLPASGRKLAGWAAIVGTVLGTLNILLYILSTGGDLDLLFRPAEALGMAPSARAMFEWSMLVDCFGFYLPFLLIGAYLRTLLKPRFGTPIDAATLALVCYVILGIAGAAMQIAAIGPLSAAYAAGDSMVRAASETVWLALVQVTQHGLWWMEGPVMAFFAVVTGRALHITRLLYGRLLIAAGVAYGTYFVAEFAGTVTVAENVQVVALALLLLWMLLIGIALLRVPTADRAT